MNRKTAYHRTCTLVGLLVMLGLGVSAPTPIHAAAGNRAHQLSAGPLVPPGGVVVTPQYCVPTASDYDLLHRCVIYMGSTHTPPDDIKCPESQCHSSRDHLFVSKLLDR